MVFPSFRMAILPGRRARAPGTSEALKFAPSAEVAATSSKTAEILLMGAMQERRPTRHHSGTAIDCKGRQTRQECPSLASVNAVRSGHALRSTRCCAILRCRRDLLHDADLSIQRHSAIDGNPVLWRGRDRSAAEAQTELGDLRRRGTYRGRGARR